MIYLYVNRAVGVLMLLVFIFFVCAITALRWDEVKRDFAEWSLQRRIKKVEEDLEEGGL